MKTDTQFILRGSDTLNLKIQNLENCFNTAKRLGYNYVAVKVDMQGFEKPEIIINSSENFEEKLDYYKKAYDENLILRSFNGIRIIGFTYGDTFESIEEDLVDE